MRDLPARDSGYSLVRHGQVIAEFEDTGGDFPWHHARLVSSHGFEEIRLALEELRGSEASFNEIGALHRRLGLRLVVWPQGWQVRTFLLWVDPEGNASVKARPPLGYRLALWSPLLWKLRARLRRN
ncbi:MAG: hypothetical protein JWN52_4686 [Actinomycetia bacterium]|nr:hypothetical protein [Actinomycetes bacterium]